MSIDEQIAGSLDLDIQHPVTRHLIQHVIQKRQSGLERGITLTIKVYEHPDLCLESFPADCCLALRHDGWPDPANILKNLSCMQS
jgi:hypothetical protein